MEGFEGRISKLMGAEASQSAVGGLCAGSLAGEMAEKHGIAAVPAKFVELASSIGPTDIFNGLENIDPALVPGTAGGFAAGVLQVGLNLAARSEAKMLTQEIIHPKPDDTSSVHDIVTFVKDQVDAASLRSGAWLGIGATGAGYAVTGPTDVVKIAALGVAASGIYYGMKGLRERMGKVQDVINGETPNK